MKEQKGRRVVWQKVVKVLDEPTASWIEEGVTPCTLVETYRQFEGKRFLLFQS
jgi:hypothetical protein